MKVELTVVGIRNYCGGEDNYSELFARLPIGCEVVLRTNRTGEPYPGSVSVYDLEMRQIGSISKTDRRFIEMEIPADGVIYANVIEHSAEHNCIRIEAENTIGIKEPYLRKTFPDDGEIVFRKTEQDIRMEQLSDIVKSQLERFEKQEITERQMPSLVKVLEEYARLCCTSLDGESSFKRADILIRLKSMTRTHPELQSIYDDIYEQSKDLGRKYNDVKVSVYRNQYDLIYASATEKGTNGKSQLDEWVDKLRFIHGGELTESDIRAEITRLAERLSNELMNKYVSCVESDEDFATALYSLNYCLHSIYVLYTRRIMHDHLTKMNVGDSAKGEKLECQGEKVHQKELPLPNAINTKRAQTYFQKAIDKGYMKYEQGTFIWEGVGDKGTNSQLAYFCGRVFEYEHSFNGNVGTSIPEDELNTLFGVTRLYSSLTQVHNAKKIQAWRRKIDELFE